MLTLELLGKSSLEVLWVLNLLPYGMWCENISISSFTVWASGKLLRRYSHPQAQPTPRLHLLGIGQCSNSQSAFKCSEPDSICLFLNLFLFFVVKMNYLVGIIDGFQNLLEMWIFFFRKMPHCPTVDKHMASPLPQLFLFLFSLSQ